MFLTLYSPFRILGDPILTTITKMMEEMFTRTIFSNKKAYQNHSRTGVLKLVTAALLHEKKKLALIK